MHLKQPTQVNITGDIVRFNTNLELGTRSEYKWVDVDQEADVAYEHPGKHTIDLDGTSFLVVMALP